MTPIVTIAGHAIPFGQANVDTDLIIPARYLKTVGRTGLGAGAFSALRQQPDNLFDRNAGAPILIAGANFGCGSSREHAPWALLDFGIRAIIAPGFADIFSGNAAKNGLLLITLPDPDVAALLAAAAAGDRFLVDLPAQTVSTAHGICRFDIDPFLKESLLLGRDEISLTLAAAPAIAAYEARLAVERPWVVPSA